MHSPSQRILGEMRAEVASIWFVPANFGEEIAMLVKTTTPSIKALLEGCAINLQFGKKDSYLVVGAKIFDMPDAPVMFHGVQRHEEEHGALQRALSERKFPAFLFNEMDACLAWSNAELKPEDAQSTNFFLDELSEVHAGVFTDEASHVLDCFGGSIDASRQIEGAEKIGTHEIPVQIENWKAVNNHFLGATADFNVNIEDRDEGEMLERVIWASLESAFPVTLHKSPKVKIGKNRREFTDVFSSYEHGSFLIEAKDLSIFKTGLGKNQEERTDSVQKQVRKAIKQLTGASKAFKRGEAIFDCKGEELIVGRDQPPHCIVLITELMPCGDWSEIVNLIAKAMEETGDFFHLIDFRELMTIIKASSGKPELIDYSLVKRCEIFCKNPDVHMRIAITAQE